MKSGSASIANGRCADNTGLLHAIDLANGRDRWTAQTGSAVGLYRSPGEVWTSVVVDADHDLFFATQSHRLIGLRPNGTRLFSLHLDSSTASYPALTGDGRLLIATDAGNLYCVG